MQLLDHVSITVRDLEREDALGFGGRNRPGDDGHTDMSYFAAFLRDPEGNKIEAVFHGHGE